MRRSRKGLASVDWPARLQKLTRGPLVEALPPGGELWLDGGHNEDCGIALARHGREWAKEPAPLPLYLIFGMLTTKDASGFLRPLARHARAARAVPIPKATPPTRRTRPAREAAEVGLDCVPANDIGAALEDLLATQPAPMRILICGSLYLAGAGSGPQRLRTRIVSRAEWPLRRPPCPGRLVRAGAGTRHTASGSGRSRRAPPRSCRRTPACRSRAG